MKLKNIKQDFISELSAQYNKREAESLFFIFLEHCCGISRIEFLSHPQLSLEQNEGEEELRNALRRLIEGEPYQHILGEMEFAGLRLKVSKAALIPRPETEELVVLIRRKLDAEAAYRILDMGTGTGCIALASAASFGKAQVVGMDNSPEALEVAKENAEKNQLEVEFICDDMLRPTEVARRTWDVITSNPPYIAEWEMEGMEKLVTGYEPAQALFAPNDDPLLYYRAILDFSKSCLNEGGRIFLEINERLGKESLELFRAVGYEASLVKDMSGKDRFVMALK